MISTKIKQPYCKPVCYVRTYAHMYVYHYFGYMYVCTCIVPDAVKCHGVSGVASTNAKLLWMAPSHINGKFKQYEVSVLNIVHVHT